MKKLVAIVLTLALAMSFAIPAMAADTIKIGVIGPLTGGAAIYGNAVANAAKIAADEINALGGMQLEIDAQDDEHDPEKSINAYNTTLDSGSLVIVGCVTSGPCAAVASQAYEDRIFMLTPSASSVDVIADKDNVYQVCFTDPAQGAASADYIAGKGLAKKVAVIYNNGDVYSTGIYQTFEAKAAEVGLEIVAVSTFTDDTTDFSVQVTEAKNAGAELVFLPIYYTPASMILTQAAAVDFKPIFFGVDGLDGILTMEGFDASLAEGVLLLTPFSADAKDEKTQNFVKKYTELYNDIPNQFAADAYDAVYAVYEAMIAGGVTADMSPEEVCEIMIEQMQQLTIDGLTGTMTWAATGEVSKTPTAVKIENGVYVGME
ncbi:MAG: ABC transporter substrate-binding protein [bacterium]|nr:ABC transporter substrate-binding protein [bacterium]